MPDIYEMKPPVDWKKIKTVVIPIVILVAVLIVLSMGNPVVIIDAGERGVIFSRLKGVRDFIMDEGLNFKIPFVESVVKFDVKTQKLERRSEGASKDLQLVVLHTVLNYHVDSKMVNKLYQEVGSDYERKVIIPAIEEAVKAGTAQFPVENIIVKRQELKALISDILKEKLAYYNVVIENVNLVDITFIQEFNKVVEQKQIEEQKIKTAEYRKKQAEEEKLMVILQAEAEATKQQLIKKTITKDIVALEWIKKWNGNLPETMLGEGTVPLIDLREKTK